MKRSGFTLVEVLIASTILFAVLITVAVSYQSARENSVRAAAVLGLLRPLPAIQSQIRSELQQNAGRQIQGQGQILSAHFQWTASISQAAPPAPRFQLEDGIYLNYKDRFYLYQIKLVLSAEGASREFTYTELAWTALELAP